MRRFLLMIILLASATAVLNGQAGKTYQERSAAMYIYNFTRYFEWPEETKSGDFIISVVGDNILYNELMTIVEGRRVGTQQIVVQNHRNINDVGECHILFLAESPSRRLSNIADQLTGFPTLFIASLDGATRNGAVINFVVKDQTMRFELHRSNAVSKGIQVDSRLDNLAIVVD
jgi:hypothetical protein